MHLCRMRLTTFTDYSLRVLIYLAAAEPARRATIAEIARAFAISENHLVKVVHFLGKRGWIGTVRGKGGGMVLARPAERISVGEVVRDAEGAALPAQCFAADGGNCLLGSVCRLKGAHDEALKAFYRVLDGYTLADITANREALAEVLEDSSEMSSSARYSRWALWQLGFRPFYLLASIFAALSIALWALQFSGWLGRAVPRRPAMARPRDAVRLHACSHRRLPVHGSQELDESTDTHGAGAARCSALLWVLARVLVLTPFGWAAADRQRRLPAGGSRRPGDSAMEGAQPAQLFLRRPAVAHRRCNCDWYTQANWARFRCRAGPG